MGRRGYGQKAKLRRQLRSQVQLGNEGIEGGLLGARAGNGENTNQMQGAGDEGNSDLLFGVGGGGPRVAAGARGRSQAGGGAPCGNIYPRCCLCGSSAIQRQCRRSANDALRRDESAERVFLFSGESSRIKGASPSAIWERGEREDAGFATGTQERDLLSAGPEVWRCLRATGGGRSEWSAGFARLLTKPVTCDQPSREARQACDK